MTATDTSQLPHTQRRPERSEATEVAMTILTVAVLVAAWATAVVIWGLPGLYIPAVAMVPVMFAALIYIAWG
ncbi:hypothetical protein [Roseovarius rhodophyticola]|uniref:Uncharacterized protein n=1 Tax=Roseovarius rhodophyticola TaxID=3080827 RepID=A0ABZ2TCT6_9RHOB|nr:hypothetical protein [Roseovarius sp. W115]MDV2931275.1 hypothetical protein [Roseovarius sp. W115]